MLVYSVVKVVQSFLHDIDGWDDWDWQAELDEDDET